eukprot:TRINITY_DN5258_c0_g1_i1.p1 TRINITY_DN5258_c0_g1~~TRINITY_DN5258_c0_g1_i1.p1  ORF type:complete len:344 (+),score=36.33 TRINITY_DN5258_c0_g1_i1:59-1090(+)
MKRGAGDRRIDSRDRGGPMRQANDRGSGGGRGGSGYRSGPRDDSRDRRGGGSVRDDRRPLAGSRGGGGYRSGPRDDSRDRRVGVRDDRSGPPPGGSRGGGGGYRSGYREDSRGRRGGGGGGGGAPARRRESPERGSRYSPPPSRGPAPRRRSPSKSRSRSRSGGRDAKRDNRPGDSGYRIPPPKRRTTQDPNDKSVNPITAEQRANCIEHDGYLYATIDFSSPYENPPWAMKFLEKNYDGSDVSDPSVTRQRVIPKDWHLVPSPAEDSLKEKVIKLYPWGTHLLVLEGGHSYNTAKGDNPGMLESLWDFTKYPGTVALSQKKGSRASHHGNFLIRRKVEDLQA